MWHRADFTKTYDGGCRDLKEIVGLKETKVEKVQKILIQHTDILRFSQYILDIKDSITNPESKSFFPKLTSSLCKSNQIQRYSPLQD